MTERLDRIEALIEANSQAIKSNSEAIAHVTDEHLGRCSEFRSLVENHR